MWSSIELVLSKVSFLHSWPFLYHPLHICFLSSPTVMYSSCQIPLSASFISLFSSTSLRRDEPFPAFPVFSIHWLLIPLLQFLSILSSCVYNFLFSILLRPSSTPSPPTCTLYILNIHLLLLISTFPMLPLTTPLPSSLLFFFFFSSSFAYSIGWLSLRSLPWSLRQRCTTTSTRGPQTTSTFRQGNGS